MVKDFHEIPACEITGNSMEFTKLLAKPELLEITGTLWDFVKLLHTQLCCKTYIIL